ncbi:MAG: cysteine rich repeat-containing protein [Parvibaculum sp.]|uniref:cysteine rich repeat-containing protein n=1 Tax=Parvibaculum sp. TaxID=2024848 RepID=UPI00284F5826|nr:cysteine rich repeat-containing protein [Parvibaculum sp.]MDR3497843.1 cysteine rich repeat-containing protein [Parvibaculum sp.]
MRTMKLIVALAAVGALQLGGVAYAADARTACKPDYERYCKSVEPGGGRIIKCLMQNESSLSQPCKEALADAKEKYAKKQAEQSGGAGQ